MPRSEDHIGLLRAGGNVEDSAEDIGEYIKDMKAALSRLRSCDGITKSAAVEGLQSQLDLFAKTWPSCRPSATVHGVISGELKEAFSPISIKMGSVSRRCSSHRNSPANAAAMSDLQIAYMKLNKGWLVLENSTMEYRKQQKLAGINKNCLPRGSEESYLCFALDGSLAPDTAAILKLGEHQDGSQDSRPQHRPRMRNLTTASYEALQNSLLATCTALTNVREGPPGTLLDFLKRASDHTSLGETLEQFANAISKGPLTEGENVSVNTMAGRSPTCTNGTYLAISLKSCSPAKGRKWLRRPSILVTGTANAPLAVESIVPLSEVSSVVSHYLTRHLGTQRSEACNTLSSERESVSSQLSGISKAILWRQF